MKRMNDLDLFGALLREITVDIISRLPIGSIIRSKLASKACHGAVESREFANCHLSKHEHEHKHDTLFVCTALVNESERDYVRTHHHTGSQYSYEIVEFTEEDGSTTTPIPITPFHPLAKYKPLPYSSSVEGLILLWWPFSHDLLVCNPITCEYARVAIDPAFDHEHRVHWCDLNYGFGVSRESKQYKLVWIVPGHGCKIYTLGTGQCRAGPSPPKFDGKSKCASMGGKIYWVQDLTNICSFDLESEIFTSFLAPPHLNTIRHRNYRYDRRRLYVLEDCLCVCDFDDDHDFPIWIMSGEGDWSILSIFLPVKVLDDIILMDFGCGKRYCYATNNNEFRKNSCFGTSKQENIACLVRHSLL